MKLLKAVLMFIGSTVLMCLIIYLPSAFYNVTFDISLWSSDLRTICGWWFTACGSISFILNASIYGGAI
jgi:hypothetical protein